jgi:phage terminase large subunit-like protein
MSKKEDQELARLARLRRLQELRKNYSLFFWTPYEKQREFHRAGKTYRERLLMAGNQLGKTICAGNEVAMHVTGLYPDWWDGKVFERETRGWVAGLTAELTRDGAQRVLLGPIGQWGSGCIPKEHILEIKRSRGVPDAVETILIKHVNGGVSQITFKASADGREAFQSETLDWLWFDEEPPITIYTEAITRTAVAMGPVFLTFTPLLGRSSVVVRFLDEPSRDRHVTKMTIEDVGHFQGEAKRIHIESYPEHERDARLRGLPMFGVGRVYAIAEEAITEKPLVYVPSNWKQIIGLDIGGFDHPTAFVLLAWDVDADCVHVLRSGDGDERFRSRPRQRIPLRRVRRSGSRTRARPPRENRSTGYRRYPEAAGAPP